MWYQIHQSAAKHPFAAYMSRPMSSFFKIVFQLLLKPASYYRRLGSPETLRLTEILSDDLLRFGWHLGKEVSRVQPDIAQKHLCCCNDPTCCVACQSLGFQCLNNEHKHFCCLARDSRILPKVNISKVDIELFDTCMYTYWSIS
jgi:hypothetical protein